VFNCVEWLVAFHLGRHWLWEFGLQKCFWSFFWHHMFVGVAYLCCSNGAFCGWQCKTRGYYRDSEPCSAVLCKRLNDSSWFSQQVHHKLCCNNWWSLLLFCKDDIWTTETQSSLCCFRGDHLISYSGGHCFCLFCNIHNSGTWWWYRILY